MKAIFKGYIYESLDGKEILKEEIEKLNNLRFHIIMKYKYEEFYSEDINIKFTKGSKVNIKEEIVLIEDVIHELNGDINYHTDKHLR